MAATSINLSTTEALETTKPMAKIKRETIRRWLATNICFKCYVNFASGERSFGRYAGAAGVLLRGG